jgi:fructosamine-3-kinase
VTDVADQVGAALGRRPARLSRLTGGCIAEVYRAEFDDGPPLVAKAGGSRLDLEGWMLGYLRDRGLPVPRVAHSAAGLLIIEFIEGESRFESAAERHAADLLADLHGVTSDAFGLERDTLIGGLPQPNPRTSSWREFFGQHRLGHMAAEAERSGGISAAARARVEKIAGELGRWLREPAAPALLHGDVWTTNVLARGGRVAAFLDPAVYYGDPEVELAFIGLFGTFGDAFYERYRERRGIADGFFEERMDLYNLYPLLVHARLFGGGYGRRVEATLARFGR